MNVMSYVELNETQKKRIAAALIRGTAKETLKWEPDGTDRHACDFDGFHIIVMKEPNPHGEEIFALTVKTKDEPYKKYYLTELRELISEIEKHEPDVLNDLILALEKRVGA